MDKTKEFSKWYQYIIFELGLLKHYDISGCYVMLPRSYYIWEQIQASLDEKFKLSGVKNVYFPLMISQNNLEKEKSHIDGFEPEVAWVTNAGQNQLSKKIAIRPTSECAIYPTMAEMIRSHVDLPIKWNQWCNVVRWEFSDPTPFVRAREFLWNEGHCAFGTKEEATKNALDQLTIYKNLYEQILCVPVISGRKTSYERFAGADETYSIEAFITEAGKAIQAATSHCLGQNFSKMFKISYEDNKGKQNLVWQTSWGLSTRSIGVTLMTHCDNKGLCLPSKICEYHLVIIPIYKPQTYDQILNYCQDLLTYYSKIKLLDGSLLRVHLDTKIGKYSYWEKYGVPLRIEVGPQELQKNLVTISSRSQSKKVQLDQYITDKKIQDMLSIYDKELFDSATQKLKQNMLYANNIDTLTQNIGKLFCCNLCQAHDCEKKIKSLKLKTICCPDLDSIQSYVPPNIFENISNSKICIVCQQNINTNFCLISKGF